MSDDIRSMFESACAQISIPPASVERPRRTGIKIRRRRTAASGLVVAAFTSVVVAALFTSPPPSEVRPASLSRTLPSQPPYPVVQGWPTVTFHDPQGPWFEPDFGEGHRVVTYGTVSYEGEQTRWSYTLFEDVQGFGTETDSETSTPATVCGELSMLSEDGSGSGGADCGLNALGETSRQREDLIPTGGGYRMGRPLVSEAGVVSTRVTRIDLEFPSGDSYQLPIFEGPPKYGINLFILFIARITEPGLAIARDEQGKVLARQLICGEPAGSTDGKPLTDEPTVTYKGVYWKVADYCSSPGQSRMGL